MDLRPLSDHWPVEIIQADGVIFTGCLTDLPSSVSDDRAANSAIEVSTRRGWFIRESEYYFALYTYWDNPDEMIGHVTEKWADCYQLSDDVQRVTRTAWASAGKGSRVRMKLKMLLTLLQKK